MFLKPITPDEVDGVRHKLMAKHPSEHHPSVIGYVDYVARHESQHNQPPARELFTLSRLKRYRISRFMVYEKLYNNEAVVDISRDIVLRSQNEGLQYLNQRKELVDLSGIFLIHRPTISYALCCLENETSLYTGALDHVQSLSLCDHAPKLITAPVSADASVNDDNRVYNDLVLFNSRQLRYRSMNLPYQLVYAYISVKSYTEVGITKVFL